MCDCNGPVQDCGKTTRRGWMFRIGTGLLSIGAMLAAIPIVGYVFSPAARKFAESWIDLGSVDKYPVGETTLASFRNPGAVPWDGYTADIPCWVRHIEKGDFQAFSIHCAHLGCPVKWFSQSRLFMCPCHGGVYYEDGSRASGPPPRGLYEFKYKVIDGRLRIDGGRLPTLQQSP